MSWHQSPSDVQIAESFEIAVDLGTVAPGQTAGFIPLPASVGLRPFTGSPTSKFPKDSFCFVWNANAEGAQSIFLLIQNNTAGPLLIGEQTFEVLVYDKQFSRP